MASKTDNERIEAKRQRVADKIREVAPHIDVLAGMLDETRLDLILIALAGERLAADEATS